MWLGIAAGLSLLTWFLARPIHARNVSVNDQQLTYVGPGWEVGAGPQACGNISQTVHSTSTTGSFVTFNFTGNGLSVYGPFTTLSTPMAVILDGDVVPVTPAVIGPDGCGILYTNSNIENDSQEHMLTMVFAADSGSVRFSISGITVNTLDAVPNAASTQFVGMPPPTSLSGVASSSSTSTTSTTAAPSNTTSTVVMNSAAASGATPPTASPSASAVATAQFVTTPGMTAIIFGAIIGAIVAMLALLVLFIFLRRRITRNSARKMDQETSSGRGGRDSEEGNGKIQEASGLAPLWSTKKEDSSQDVSTPGSQETQSLNLNVPYASPAGSLPSAVMSASSTPPGQPVAAAYSSRVESTTSAYAIPLEAAHYGRSPGSDTGNDEQPPLQRPVVQSSFRQPPPPIRIPRNLPVPPMSSALHSRPPPGLKTATTFNPTSAYSAAATVGGTPAREGPQFRVINRSESVPRSTIDPPPGFV